MIEIDFKKGEGLVPVIIQDAADKRSPDAGIYEQGILGEDP